MDLAFAIILMTASLSFAIMKHVVWARFLMYAKYFPGPNRAEQGFISIAFGVAHWVSPGSSGLSVLRSSVASSQKARA